MNHWYFCAPKSGWKGVPHFVGTAFRMTMIGDFTKEQAIACYVEQFQARPQGDVFLMNPT